MAWLPIVERELRVSARKPLTHWLRFSAGLGGMVLWVVLIAGDRSNDPARLGHSIFIAMTIPVLAFCMLCGLFLTADALSEEKREGTLGLLFLTPLKPYDVVLGKLAATSLQAVFGVVSIFPILALPLMLGGVSGAEFLRVVLVLVATLFFSLALGLCVSATAFEARQALGWTLALLLAVCAGGPLIWLLQSLFLHSSWLTVIRWPSPAFAFYVAFEPTYKLRGASIGFAGSLLMVLVLAVASGIIACFKLHRSVRDAPPVLDKNLDIREAKQVPRLSLDSEPFYWLVSRQGMNRIWRKISSIAILLWVMALLAAMITGVRGPPIAILVCMGILYGLHQVLKIFITIESTRRFSEDRQSGALELLLVSPLQTDSILKDHARAIRGQFKKPIQVLAILNMIFGLSMLIVLHEADGEEFGFCAIALAGIALLLSDSRALLWLGMWRAIAAKRHHWAVLQTLLTVMGPPWFFVFLTCTGFGDSLSFAEGMTATAIWTAASIGLSRWIESRARRKLGLQFRSMVAGDFPASRDSKAFARFSAKNQSRAASAAIIFTCCFSAQAAYIRTNLAPPAVEREFRGAWITTLNNITWPSKPGLPVAEQKREMLNILDVASRVHLNALLFQVRPACDAFYESRLEPWSDYLSGEMGTPPAPWYDPLAFAVEEAHKRGLELHAWFNPFRARHFSGTNPPSLKHISKTHPEWVRRYGKDLWLDPGEPAVHDHTIAVILDVVRRYDIDAVVLDDYFYPYKEKERDRNGRNVLVEFSDNTTWNRYRAGGGKLARDDWRRENINRFVQRLDAAIKAENKEVRFGLSPFGIWRPGFPASVKGLDAYGDLYADSRKWLQEGWVDYFAPQLYWPVNAPNQSFPALLNWWAEQNPKGRHLWPGDTLTGLSSNRSPGEIIDKILITRKQGGAPGNIHFNFGQVMRNAAGITDALIGQVYAAPALVPASPWINGRAPQAPEVKIVERAPGVTLTWDKGADPVRFWLLQTKSSGKWSSKLLPANTNTLNLDDSPEVIALSGLSRSGLLSVPAVFAK